MRFIPAAELAEATEQQLAVWPEAQERYQALGATERRIVSLGSFPVILQHNPARAKSTEAKVDAASIAARPCFLCPKNRPAEQFASAELAGWEILVNPYPIFPLHLTVASAKHEPQKAAPALDMLELAAASPGLACFFNGAKAGASAPDHLHFQCVRADEVPLLGMVEQLHPQGAPIALSPDFLPDAPASFWSLLLTPDETGRRLLRAIPFMTGATPDGKPDSGLVNVFIWTDSSGFARAIVIPRRRHRPTDYGTPGAPAISPGALDAAGVMIAPRASDYASLDAATISRIYAQTCFDASGIEKLSENLGII